ncbi:hypothetical protein NDU88_006541 [Pleurodeles waltl]|uniref:Uncharacterized protein n=1 Tax=Pleurodeles waltl TaxID=8319 RepID=A0AAV7QJ19_PLEWA|nr:hypothetical protein NDU88_006541 [Pleurodeles waltl]
MSTTTPQSLVFIHSYQSRRGVGDGGANLSPSSYLTTAGPAIIEYYCCCIDVPRKRLRPPQPFRFRFLRCRRLRCCLFSSSEGFSLAVHYATAGIQVVPLLGSASASEGSCPPLRSSDPLSRSSAGAHLHAGDRAAPSTRVFRELRLGHSQQQYSALRARPDSGAYGFAAAAPLSGRVRHPRRPHWSRESL